MNKCIFVGRTTKDVELRYTQAAEPLTVGRTSIAVETGFGNNKKTHFFNIAAFGKQAETMEKFVKKGTKIVLECEATQNNYKDRNGNAVQTVSFIVRNFEFAESKNSASKQEEKAHMQVQDGFYPMSDDIGDDDVPF